MLGLKGSRYAPDHPGILHRNHPGILYHNHPGILAINEKIKSGSVFTYNHITKKDVMKEKRFIFL